MTVTNPGSSGGILAGLTPQAQALAAATALSMRPGIGYYQGFISVSTTGTPGNGGLRLQPVFIPNPCTLLGLFAEFTVASEANGWLVPALYADVGNGFPGNLVIAAPSISTGSGNAGSVATAGTPGVYLSAVSQALAAGLYWVGGVVQNCPTTQPTVRTGSFGGVTGYPGLPGVGSSALIAFASGIAAALPTPFAGAFSGGGGTRVGLELQV